MGEQARASVGDGDEGLGWPHGRQLVGLAGLLPGPLLKDLDHGVLLNDLSVKSLDSEVGEKNNLLISVTPPLFFRLYKLSQGFRKLDLSASWQDA